MGGQGGQAVGCQWGWEDPWGGQCQWGWGLRFLHLHPTARMALACRKGGMRGHDAAYDAAAPCTYTVMWRVCLAGSGTQRFKRRGLPSGVASLALQQAGMCDWPGATIAACGVFFAFLPGPIDTMCMWGAVGGRLEVGAWRLD